MGGSRGGPGVWTLPFHTDSHVYFSMFGSYIWDSVFVSVLEQQQSNFTWTNRMDWTAFNE